MTSVDPGRRSLRWWSRNRHGSPSDGAGQMAEVDLVKGGAAAASVSLVKSAQHLESVSLTKPVTRSTPVSLMKAITRAAPVNLMKPVSRAKPLSLMKPVSLTKRVGRSSPAATPVTGPSSLPRPSDQRIVDLVREISELRLSAATHLTVAAAAMDAGRPDIASELIDAQQRDVALLRHRAAELLSVEGEDADAARRTVADAAVREETSLLAAARVPERTSLLRSSRAGGVALLPRRTSPRPHAPRWSAAGALLAIAATVAVGLLRPLAPAPTTSAPDPQTINASVVASLDANVVRSYDQLQVTAKPRTAQVDVEEATARLHADLQRLLPLAATDPVAAQRVLDVLDAERVLLTEHAPGTLDTFAPEAALIITQLRSLASPAVLALLPQAGDLGRQPAPAVGGTEASDPQPTSTPASAPAAVDPGSATLPPTSEQTQQPVPPAPVVVPDPPRDPSPAPPATGQDNSSGSGDAPAPAQDTSGGQAPAPQLPAPLVVDPAAN